MAAHSRSTMTEVVEPASSRLAALEVELKTCRLVAAQADEALDRLEARERLAGLERRRLELMVEVERAEKAAAVVHRERIEQALAEGKRLVDAELPELVRAQRALQARWRAFAAKCEAMDHRAGGMPHFGSVAWSEAMGPGGTFDAFVRYVSQSYAVGE